MFMILNFLAFLIFCSLINISIKCQQSDYHTLIELNKKYNGTLQADFSYAYYKLIIPEGVVVKTKNLVFKIKEPDSALNGIDDFSDPDIYVSTINQYPKSSYESEFYSEKYGEDLLSIPNEKVFSNQTFYISIFCEKKCKYEFTGTLESEWNVMDNETYSFYLTRDNSISLKFQQTRETFKELEFISYSPKMSAYRIYISEQGNPSSTNTLTIIPSWVGGYYASVTKNSIHFCKNCTYNILIEAENDFAEVFLTIKYEDTVSNINSQEYTFSTLKPFQRHCYSIDVTEKYKNEDIIVQTTLFSGSADLLINPWDSQKNSSSFKFKKDILNEDVTLITPTDRNNQTHTTGKVFICLKSYDYTSYLLKVFFSSQTENLQKFNFLFSGITVNGYLPAGAVTRHRATEFTASSDIFFKMKVYSGNPQFYGYICEEARKCFFSKDSVELLKPNLTIAERVSDEYKITIPNSKNICHKKLKKEDSFKNDIAILPCAVFAVVYCEGNQPCIYTIQATHTNSILRLRERKPHYQLVAYNDTDTYKFIVRNPNVENITIILNSITGDADIQVKGLNNTYESGSFNEGYTPDVITITRDQVTQKSLLGEYIVKVKGSTFASYSLLYYTYEKSSEEDNTDFIKPQESDAISLEMGQVIKDFIVEYPNATNYKIYSYNQKILPNQDAMDIRINLTPEHSDYQMYVLFDISNLKFDSNNSKNIKNYIWKSNYNNEIVIEKTDPNYSKFRTYFIVIIPRYTYNDFSEVLNTTNTSNNSTSKMYLNSYYYLGVTNEIYPFILQESIPTTVTLLSNYSSQLFWYYHYNVSNPVSISLNVYYGRVDLMIDMKWSADITKSQNAIKILDTDSTFFSIPSSKLKEYSMGFNSIPIYVYVRKSSNHDSSFLLSFKSNLDVPEKLKPGLVRQDNLLSGELKYFYMVLGKNIHGLLDVAFKNGYGNVYVNIFDSNDHLNDSKYPNSTSYMYSANDNYIGKSLVFNKDILDKCNKACKVLISIHGSNLGYSTEKIEFSLSYYQDALKINQNQPYKNQIQQGELKFFRVYFPKTTQNVYMSLTNMGGGDADIYVNYGDDLPSFDNYVWSSATPFNEFVDFNINDPYFVANNKTDISGNYTIMIYGFTKTTYTLYITPHPKKIIPLEDNSLASCSTTKENDSCYFRYDDIYDFYWGDYVIGIDENNSNTSLNKDLNLIVNTEFIYGNGIIYAKLYNDTDYDILQDFPDQNNYDFSNTDSNIRNFVRMNVKSDNPKYNKNSTILITVKCPEKCFFDLIATKQRESTIKYLDYSRDNVYYISRAQNQKNVFIYYNNRQGDLDVYVNALEGQANIKIYSNNTIFHRDQNLYSYEIKELGNLESSYPSKDSLHKTISSTNLTLYENLFFEVTPYTDYTFSMRLTYQHDWTKIKLGVMNGFKINSSKKRFYGYFHIHNIYENILLTMSLNNKNLTAYAYVKYVIYDKNQKNKDGFDIVPSENESDFKANTLNLMNLIALRLPKLPSEKVGNKMIKVLFSVLIFDFNSFINTDADNIYIHISAIPEINKVSKSSIPERTVFYSLLQGYEKASNSTIQIYDLKRKNVEDDTLTIEISSCKGMVDMIISKNLLTNIKDADSNRILPSSIQNSNGRTVYKFTNLDSNNYYMMLNGRKIPDIDCRPGKNHDDLVNCGNNLSMVLVYYYTTKSQEETKDYIIPRESIVYEVIDGSTIKLKWTPIIELDVKKLYNPVQEKFKLVPANYEIYISNSEIDYLYMDSVCYLNNINSTSLVTKIEENKKEAKIFGLYPNKKYFINILAKRLDQFDVVAYKTIEVILEKTGPSTFSLVLIAIVVIVLMILVWYFYKKYKFTKQILNYEVNDVRNLSNIPKSEAEMKEITNRSQKKSYQNLTEDTSAV